MSRLRGHDPQTEVLGLPISGFSRSQRLLCSPSMLAHPGRPQSSPTELQEFRVEPLTTLVSSMGGVTFPMACPKASRMPTRSPHPPLQPVQISYVGRTGANKKHCCLWALNNRGSLEDQSRLPDCQRLPPAQIQIPVPLNSLCVSHAGERYQVSEATTLQSAGRGHAGVLKIARGSRCFSSGGKGSCR